MRCASFRARPFADATPLYQTGREDGSAKGDALRFTNIYCKVHKAAHVPQQFVVSFAFFLEGGIGNSPTPTAGGVALVVILWMQEGPPPNPTNPSPNPTCNRQATKPVKARW